jgi:hypothetical protein
MSLILFCAITQSTGKRDNRVVAYPADPTQGFHKVCQVRIPLVGIATDLDPQYSLSWYPDTCTGAINTARATEFRFDGALQSGPALYSSTHPARMVINHYTTADKTWGAGPPATDAVMIVKKVVAYYDKPTKVAEGACPIRGDCDPSISCKVTI